MKKVFYLQKAKAGLKHAAASVLAVKDQLITTVLIASVVGMSAMTYQAYFTAENDSPATQEVLTEEQQLKGAFEQALGKLSLAGISGSVFRDYNSDGMQQAGEPGREGIIVKFYSDAPAPGIDSYLGQTTTDAVGNYMYNPPSYPVRIEFSIPTGLCNLDPDQDFAAPNGETYGTAVQFASGPGTYNFIINYPADFSTNDNPKVFVPCFVNGNPLLPGTAQNSDAFVRFNYLDQGIGSNSGYPGAGGPPHDLVATASQVGTVWGIAYSRQAKVLFTSAFLKRHAGMGPLGPGGIYRIEADNFSGAMNYNWLDFDSDLNIPTNDESNPYTNALTGPGSNEVFFSPVVGSNANRGLSPNKADPSQDAAAWEQVGKVSFGDIDISEDGQFLYVMNLYDRKLYQIDLQDPYNPVAPSAGDVGTKVKGFAVPDPCSGSSGEHRPFALKFARGKVYVGVICSAQNASGQVVGGPLDMDAFVYEFDVATQSFNNTPLLQFNLNYRATSGTPWIPWNRRFKGDCFECEGYPMLSDIELDGKGNMLLALMDRRGHQMGFANHDLNGNGFHSMAATGDLLRAVRDPNNNACSYSISFSPEYYNDNKIHGECVQGALAVHRTPNVDNVMATFLDPITIWSGGVMRFNNNNGGQIDQGYQVFYGDATPFGTFGKANGLGDLEAIQEEPSIEIGNRVWNDTDGDGIQDAGEPGIPGVEVKLKWPNGTVLATTTTNADGEYYFFINNVPDGDPIQPGAQLGIQPNTAYKICIPAAEFTVGNPLNHHILTLLDQTGAGLADLSDNDGVLQGNGDAQIMVTTGKRGENDHSLDFGFIPVDYGDLPDTYGTTDASNGAWHWITNRLYMGNCVDSETNGQPGTGTSNDDGNLGLAYAGSCNDGGTNDDENGVVFVTPMIPGSTATLLINVTNITGSAARLQGWIDFNGNGVFDPTDQLTDGSFAPNGLSVPNGGLTNFSATFTVPANATFQGGVAFIRFRLSPSGVAGATGGDVYGEVEDYQLVLAKVGNLVWTDFDDDGVQDNGEAGINGVDINLTWLGPDGVLGGGDDIVYTTTTANMNGNDGIYMFQGLTSGMYKITPNAPAGFIGGKEDQGGNDFTDSDAHSGVMVTINNPVNLPTGENGNGDNPGGTNGFADNQDNISFDFNYIGLDYGDLPDSYGTSTPNGPGHVVTPNLKIGARVDAESNGQPDAMAGAMTGGDDNNQGAPAFGGNGDDEDGIIFETPMIPGTQACIRVSAMNMTAASAKLQAWVDWNGNGQFDALDQITTGDFAPTGATVPVGGLNAVRLCFDVPANATFANGNAMIRFRLSPAGGLTATGGLAGGNLPQGEVEDYKLSLAKIGNLVWNDYNNDGQQNEPASVGINGVTVQLVYLGQDGVAGGTGANADITYTTVTATEGTVKGKYNFCGLIPGAYKVSVPTAPAGFSNTNQNVGSDVSDADNAAGEMVMIPDPASTLPLGENSTGDDPGTNLSFPDPQDNLTFDFGYVQFDYGDLPNTYSTTTPGGPSHIVNPDLKLGACVDAETNGNPEPMAGLMTGGDDNATGQSPDGTPSTCGDDEDGIVFESPMVPGTTACIRVTAMNATGANAVLQAWIDFNGDGDFDLNEQLNTGSFAPNGATVPNGGLVNAQLCFDVPANATFNGGQAMVRFRLSQNGGLTPGGVGGYGEVEDHKLPLAKIGNFVWVDYDNDGQQDTGEPGLNGVTVNVVWSGPDADFGTTADNRTFTTVTATMNASDGVYMVLGLVPGMYKVSVVTPTGYVTGLENIGDDVKDSDLHNGEMVSIPNPIALPLGENGTADNPGGTNGFPDAQDNLTIDFNFVAVDYGDLPDTYGTTSNFDGPAHVVNPNLKLGACVDGELDGQPEPMAGMMTGGDDNNTGIVTQGNCTPAGDDENGIAFTTPLVPGAQACVTVTAMNMTGANAVLQGWIDWNGNGEFDANEQLVTGAFAPAGAIIPNGGVTNQAFCFTVPDDAPLVEGNVFARFRLSPTGGLGATGDGQNGVIPAGEVEDYKLPTAKIGNIVWWDYDNDGQQDATEPGINNVTVQLVWSGPDGNLATTGDNITYTEVTATQNGVNGQYAFCGLLPGAYKLSIPTPPANFTPTQLNLGNDVTDSEDPAGTMVMIPNPPTTLPTGENGLGDNPGAVFADNQDDLTFDFGYIALDYGDLPDTYTTTNGNNGPSQLLNPNLYLGTCADAELNGQPDPMAGLMTGGDDNNTSTVFVGNCGQTGDDENGIVAFETPMIPGYTACIRLTANNTTGANAVVQAWVDFNGNGTFETGEQLTTGSFAPSGAVVPNGGLSNAQLCFEVPQNATFTGGQAMIRLRLSQNGGLTPSGPSGIGGIGEVEDYKLQLAKIGNLVWNDYNNDGQQNEPGSAGLNNITVQLVWGGPDNNTSTQGDNRTYITTTSTMTVDGQYMFLGLTPGMYKVSIPTLPQNYQATQIGLGGDVSDSEDPAGEMVSIPAPPTTLPTGENSTGDVPNDPNFPDNQNNLTIDFGLITRDFGDAPDTYGSTDGSPLDGPSHVVNPNLKLGACIDGDPDGQPDSMAGLMTGGDDNSTGVNDDGVTSTCGDDEDGIMLVTPLIPGSTATIMVTAMNTTGENAVLQGWIDFNGDGDFNDAGEALVLSNATVPSPAGLAGVKLTFPVPASATYTGGNAFMRFRLSPNGGLSPNGPENAPYPQGEVEDYKVPLSKIGNYVWNDNNNDGIQNEPGSNGLNNVTVQLVWLGTDGVAGGGDDLTYTVVTSNMNGVNGQYMFLGLTPGMYKLSIPTHPAGFIPTQLNIGNDVTDGEDPAGTMVVIPNPPTTLPTGENGTGDVPNDPNFPDNQNDLTYDFGFVSVDHGDLPNTYGTTNGANGPQHVVNPNLKLGASVDGELDGQPEAMAGLMTGGDDGNNGGYNEGGAGDDENGVVFLTPMIPGFQACVRVTTMNTLGGTAVLQGWVDWNGDGDVADAGEQINTGAFAAAAPGAIVPAGANVTSDFCFDVPATATFFGGQAFARFRLSPTGGLNSGGPANMPFPIGEVEDYKVPLAKAGNYVWIDANINGIQDEPGVLGINNVTVELQWAGPDGNFATTIDNRTYTDVTAVENAINGKYMFCGLIPGNYRMVVPPFGYVPTLVLDVAGNTQDFVDSDNPAGVNFTVPNPPTTLPTGENGTGDSPLVINGFPDNQGNFSFDFGYLGFDFGDLPESYGTTQGAGNPGPDGAVHTVNPDLYLGPCVDIDIDGQPEAMAGFMTGGDDGNAGPGSLGTCTPLADDENDITFPTPLIPGNQACVNVTARNNTGGPAILQAWIDFNGNGTFEAGEQLTTGSFAPSGATIPNGGVNNQAFCFDVPANATFNGGNLFVRFRLSKNGGVGATGPAVPGNGVFPTGEVEDYKLPLALIGNYVWMDNPDIEGDQDATEMPLANVKVNLTWSGPDGIFQTPANSATATGDDRIYMVSTNANGYYEFRGLIPSSTYRLLPHKYTALNGTDGATINPVNKILTIPNLGPANDNNDSDAAPAISVVIPNLTTVFLPTAENGLQDGTPTGFPDNQANISLDFGFIDEPRINASMAIMGFFETTCGHFGVIQDICIKNTSTAPLASLQAMLDLAGPGAYGTAFLNVVGVPEIVSSTAQQNPVINAGFTGASTAPGKNLFNGTSGLLWPGEQICIRVRFDVDPLATGAPANPKSQAMISGKAQNFQGVPIPDYWNGGAQYTATDLSDGGTDPMSSNSGSPGDTGGTNDPTPLGNCWQSTQNMVCNDFVNISMDSDCNAYITESDVLEGEDPNCDEDNYPLGGFFVIKITTNTGQVVPNPVPQQFLGQTLTYSIKHIMSCNPCWGNFKIEDKLAPEVVCEDIHLTCVNDDYSPATLQGLGIDAAFPDIFDCSNFTSNYVDTWHDLACGEGFNGQDDLSAYVERKWQVADQWGNATSCTQYIYFHRLHNIDVFFPTDVTVSCSDGNTSPAVTGAPYVEFLGREWDLWPSVGFCELSVTHTDVRIPVCDGTYKIERTWRLHDWCSPTSAFPPFFNPMYFIQIITVMDNEGPSIACPANLTVSTDPFNCCATVNLPDALVTDNCSRVNNISAMIIPHEYYTGDPLPMVTATGTLTDFPGNNWWAPDTMGQWGWTTCLPLGTHTVIYLAEDDCGNTATCEFQLTVADLIPPVAACDEQTVVGINYDDPYDCYEPSDACEGAGVTWVKATTFDDGSYDECSLLKFTIRRMAPYSDCINNLSKEPCYPGGLSEFDIATAELDSIKFYCCEVGSTQTVILRVYQVDYDGNYVLGSDGEPLFNECMVQVDVQDKIKPFCAPPANVTVTCEQFDPSLWVYGKADVLDNCCLDETKVYQGQCGLTHSVSYTNFDTLCNKGTIVRTFRAFDCHGQSSQCTQRIVVNYEQDYYVRFPDDKIVSVCDGTGDYGAPTFFGEDCELLGVSFEDEIFTVVPDACFKIERHWKIINWCTFNPNGTCINVPNPNPNATTNHPTNLPGPIVSPIQTPGDPWKSSIVKINPTDPNPGTNYSIYYDPNANCYTYSQIIKIIDTQDPIVECPASPVTICDVTGNDADLWNASYWWDNANQSHDLCEAPSDICITATDACSGANINFEYQLFLDLDGDGVMETVVNSTQLGNQVGGLGWNNILFGNATGAGQPRAFDGRPVPTNQKWGFAIQETVTGNNKTACVKFNTFQQQNTYVTPQLPHGTHKIKWFVSDGCGNETVCEYTIIVKDCKAPTVVCLNGLSVNIMPTGMITMWASDFLQYAEDNCTQTPWLKYGIRKCGQGTGFPVDANGNPITQVTFTCDELGTQCVELWAIDLAGNADYCETYVIVQDNAGNCPNGNINVSGALKTEMTDGVEEAEVQITGSVNFAPPFNYFDMTNDLGTYEVLNSVPVAATMTITPVKDDNPLNGLTTYDLVLIQKHILGIDPLDSPYKMIAADANKSNSITTFDIVELRKLILGMYTELPANTSWRFVDKTQVFTNPANPFMDVIKENISIADAQVNQLDENFVAVKIGDVNNTAVANSAMQVDDRTVGTLMFDVEDREVKAGESFDVTFTTSEPAQGYQMTLNLNGLSAVAIVGDDHVSESNFGVFEDALTVSIDGAQSFTVKFRAAKSGKLSEMLGVSSRITKAEGYSLIDGRLDVALRFDKHTIIGVGFELYQNQPNPFVNKTVIGFHLPEATQATLTVFDENGRLIFSQKGDFAQGYNTFLIDRQLIGTTGALWYRVETPSHSASRTMIQTK